MAKRKMTFDEYDALCERLAELPFRPGGYWPEKKEIDSLNTKSEKDLDFLIWLVEENPAPENEKDKETKRYINKILREVIELT